ncbi:IclR family transcriptional regulator [Cupriavidus necator]|nr:IclR family transcriptional regulator [Cupriavidus necator]MDX6008129.1 IclR family transcriptional regulator [Cupriavidus necator]
MSVPRRVPLDLLEYEGDRQFATTLARGIALLRCFTPEEPVLGNKELSRRLELPVATISRLTYTLVAMGYLAQDEPHGKYRLGSAVLSLSYPLLELFTIRRRARPYLLELAESTGGSVSIGIRDRLSVVYIEAIRSHHHKVYPLDVGTRQSLAGTAIGRAYLMSCAPSEREALMNQLRVRAPEEWQRHQAELRRNMAEYSRWGACVSVGEIFPDVQAVAVPLGRIDRGEPAALNCAFQGRPLNRSWLLEEIGPKLQALARQLM